MSYITISNVSKNFKELNALKKISLDIEKGEFVTLLGPSGCGKSTLLRIIAGLEVADSGEVFIDDKNMNNIPVNKRHIGMVFQAYSLFPNMTTSENVAFGLKLKKLPENEVDRKVSEILKLVGLNGREHHYPHQLSGGQQQRVALARALVVNPDVLLLDEPLSALDAKIRLNLRYLIKDLQQKLKITTIFVTHDQEEALSLSDRIFVMDKGNIVQIGTPEDIYRNPINNAVAGFIGTYNFIDPNFLNVWEDRHHILVRPEHIEIVEANKSQTDLNLYDGTITNVYFLGNIIRLNVLVDECTLIVDTLNRNGNHYKINQPIRLRIPENRYTRLA